MSPHPLGCPIPERPMAFGGLLNSVVLPSLAPSQEPRRGGGDVSSELRAGEPRPPRLSSAWAGPLPCCGQDALCSAALRGSVLPFQGRGA